jgi:type IV secretion system protein VirB11
MIRQPIEGEATLRWLLEPIAEHLAHPATTEVVIDRPGTVGVEQGGIWTWHEVPSLDSDHLEAIAILSARMTGKDISSARPSCVSKLPDGQRIKMLLPPRAPGGSVSLCIRKRALSFTPTLGWLHSKGYFDMLDQAVGWPAYFEQAIGDGKTIILSGAIGSSKTTCAEALLRAIPLSQRIVTVEGSPEWLDLPHENWCATYFDEAETDSATLAVQDVMQLRPDWACLQEARGGGEAWAFLRLLKVGMPGITTVHAPTARRALDSLEGMIRQSPEGRGLTVPEIHQQLRQYIGAIAHCQRIAGDDCTRYRMTEVLELGQTEDHDRIVSCSRS